MSSRLSKSRIDLLQILINSEPTIFAKVQNWNDSSNKTPTKVSIREDGQVTFYFGKGPIWWQRIFDDYESVSIIDTAIRIADALTGSGETRNMTAFEGITRAILKEAIEKRELDTVVDILFDNVRNGTTGELRSKYINEQNIKQYVKEKGITSKIIDSDLYGFVGIQLRPGAIAPIKVGRIVSTE